MVRSNALPCGVGAGDDCHVLQAGVSESDFIAAENAISALEDINGIHIGADPPDAAPVLFEDPDTRKGSCVRSDHEERVAAIEQAPWLVSDIGLVGGHFLLYQLDFSDFVLLVGRCRENVYQLRRRLPRLSSLQLFCTMLLLKVPATLSHRLLGTRDACETLANRMIPIIRISDSPARSQCRRSEKGS